MFCLLKGKCRDLLMTRLLLKCTFKSTYEPPAEKADEVPDDDRSDGDAGYGTREEVGPSLRPITLPDWGLWHPLTKWLYHSV